MNEPAGQLEHAVADEAEYDPAVQTPVTAVRPPVAQYEPAMHAVQELDPVVAIKEPASQTTGQPMEPELPKNIS